MITEFYDEIWIYRLLEDRTIKKGEKRNVKTDNQEK